MTPAQTAATYDRIAKHWDGPGFNRANGIAQHERALAFLGRAGAALDIGCGASGRIIELLLARGFAVEGLDLSREMLARAARRHPAVRFHHADICTWTFPHAYDFVSAWDSLWHVPLERQLAVLARVCGQLSPGGVLIFTTGGVERAEEVTNPCFGEPLYHAAPGIPAVLRMIEAAACRCRHLEYDQYPENHVYLVVQHG